HRLYLCSLLFSALLPPPPTSTLFPYTTLFRSLVGLVRERALGFAAARSRRVRNHAGLRVGEFDAQCSRRDGCFLDRVGASVTTGDRKSTRLNSSHVSISYAVFCLKKKKK